MGPLTPGFPLAGMVGLLLPVLIGLALLITAVVAVARKKHTWINEAAHPGLGRLQWSAIQARVIGLVAAVAVAPLMAMVGRYGWGVFLAPSVSAVVLLAAVSVVTVSYYAAARKVGQASLEVRKLGDYVPKRGLRWLLVATVGLLLTGLTTGMLASPDPQGRSKELHFQCLTIEWTDGQAGSTARWDDGALSRFPGWYYLSAVLIGTLLLAAATWFALWLNAWRPRNGSDAMLVATDDAVRRQTGEGIIATATAGVSLTWFGVAYLAALGFGLSACSTPRGLTSWGFAAVGLGALVLAIQALATAVVPGDGAAR
ncbi:MAG: hypothetical protein WAV45_04225 [Propionibacteriaceae bacterium]|nr:hypothetical protein [Micropruina sp.]HBX79719.1 hypothetical protein [Propionibacteriaceae bacterium]HBY23127.1 hypothetical protein [Propionibacteriaceae bacterium]